MLFKKPVLEFFNGKPHLGLAHAFFADYYTKKEAKTEEITPVGAYLMLLQNHYKIMGDSAKANSSDASKLREEARVFRAAAGELKAHFQALEKNPDALLALLTEVYFKKDVEAQNLLHEAFNVKHPRKSISSWKNHFSTFTLPPAKKRVASKVPVVERVISKLGEAEKHFDFSAGVVRNG